MAGNQRICVLVCELYIQALNPNEDSPKDFSVVHLSIVKIIDSILYTCHISSST